MKCMCCVVNLFSSTLEANEKFVLVWPPSAKFHSIEGRIVVEVVPPAFKSSLNSFRKFELKKDSASIIQGQSWLRRPENNAGH